VKKNRKFQKTNPLLPPMGSLPALIKTVLVQNAE